MLKYIQIRNLVESIYVLLISKQLSSNYYSNGNYNIYYLTLDYNELYSIYIMINKEIRRHNLGDVVSVGSKQYAVSAQTIKGWCMDCSFISSYRCHSRRAYGTTVLTDICRQGFIFKRV